MSSTWKRNVRSSSGNCRVCCLLLCDIVGSTQLIEELGDLKAARVFQSFDSIVRSLLPKYHAREIDRSDGFLILFERPIDGVCWSLEVHEKLRKKSLGGEHNPLMMRVGIHLGEAVIHVNSDSDVKNGAKPIEVEGLAKHVAARIASLAIGGQTLITRTGFDLVRRAAAGDDQLPKKVKWKDHGLYHFKGSKETYEIFEVGMQGVSPFVKPADKEKARNVGGEVTEISDSWQPKEVSTLDRISDENEGLLDQKAGSARVTVRCRHCGTENELPWLFCSKCEQTRVALGFLPITINVLLAMGAFLSSFVFYEFLSWSWPIYALYSLLAIQSVTILRRGQAVENLLLSLWLLSSFLVVALIFHFGNTTSRFFLLVLRDLPSLFASEPLIYFPLVLAIISPLTLPILFQWQNRFGSWTAYRMSLVAIMGLQLALLCGFSLMRIFADQLATEEIEEELYALLAHPWNQFMLTLGYSFCLVAFVFLMELLFTSIHLGYRRSGGFGSKRSWKTIQKENPLLRAVYSLWDTSLVLFLWMEKSLLTFWCALVESYSSLKSVSYSACRFYLAPAMLTLTVAVILLFATQETVLFVQSDSLLALARLLSLVIIAQATLLFFLILKTPFSWRDIVRFYIHLLGWILPNLLILYLLTSVSLSGAARLLNSHLAEPWTILPFKVGIVTQNVAAALLAIIAISLLQKRIGFSHQAEQEAAEH